MQLAKRMRDVIVAGAVGDAIGYKVEFSSITQIYNKYNGNLKLDHLINEKINISDDTQMTLFLLEYLNENNLGDINEGNIRSKFTSWLSTQTGHSCTKSKLSQFNTIRHSRAPGTTCLASLSRGDGIDSKGCGAVMRTAPCAFVDDLTTALKLSKIQSEVTHTNRSAVLPALILTELLHILLHSENKNICKIIKDICKKYTTESDAETVDCILKAIHMYEAGLDNYISGAIHNIGGGWVGHEALAIAILCVLCAKSMDQLIVYSVNHNGDSDSTASIAMQIWAAAFSSNEIIQSFFDNNIVERDAINYILELDYNLGDKMNFELYGKDGCDYCDRAKNVFEARDIQYKFYKLGVDCTKEDIQQRVGPEKKINVVPQIFLNGKYLGGYIDLLELLAKDKTI